MCQIDNSLWRYNGEQVRHDHGPEGACSLMELCGRDIKQSITTKGDKWHEKGSAVRFIQYLLSLVFLYILYVCSWVIAFTLLDSTNDSQIESSSSDLSKYVQPMFIGSFHLGVSESPSNSTYQKQNQAPPLTLLCIHTNTLAVFLFLSHRNLQCH